MMIARHYRIGIAENEVMAVISGFLAVGAILWQWYQGWKAGTLNAFGGVKK